MSGLWWMAVVLVMFLSAQNSVAAYDEKELADLVKVIQETYQPSFKNKPIMFAMAVTIPYNKNRGKYDFSGVKEEGPKLRKEVLKCSVYITKQIIAATVLKYDRVDEQCPHEPVQWPELLRDCPKARTWTEFQSDLCPKEVRDRSLKKLAEKKPGLVDHAEYRVLDHFNEKLAKKINTDDLLLFYSWGSPCDDKCTNKDYQYNILETITQIRKWKNYVYVFSKPFKPPHVKDEKQLKNNLRTALKNLGNKVDLNKIYRCDKDQNDKIVCKNCSNNGQVLDYCVNSNEKY
ncbi:uncharacterized protein LOC115426496 [Sphaeramia orbicularis]|uniref:uncharacterized protein LOC115426496 n=1 Tax=Sphaeramia orbicularis TaxID=375764 RepID=UPI00117DE453|nr:uncharacterized protein LOC115426496 [Sphaeramia orbicularis]